MVVVFYIVVLNGGVVIDVDFVGCVVFEIIYFIYYFNNLFVVFIVVVNIFDEVFIVEYVKDDLCVE